MLEYSTVHYVLIGSSCVDGSHVQNIKRVSMYLYVVASS